MSNTVQNEADTKTTFSQNQKQALQTRKAVQNQQLN